VAASAVEIVKRKPTEDWMAYDFFLQGRERDSHYDLVGAEAFYARAAELDPRYCHAHALRAIAVAVNNWVSPKPDVLRRAEEFAHLALSIDPHDAWSHQAVAYVAMCQGKFDLAGIHFERASTLNPNDVLIAADHAGWLVRTGRPAEAIQRLDAVIQRDPFPATWIWEIRFTALFQLRRYDEALTALSSMSKFNAWHGVYFAAAYGQIGRLETARETVNRLVKELPGASITLVSESEPYADRELLEHLLDGLRKAGLPE
jgi:adenylate cyclase